MNRSESIAAISAALAKAQGEMKNPTFDSKNPHFGNRYASLAAVRDAIVPALSKNGIAIVQHLSGAETGVVCETVLMHSSGEWISSTLELPVGKHDAQGVGSAATYARRYSAMAIAQVVGDTDDDANQAAAAVVKMDADAILKSIAEAGSEDALKAIWKQAVAECEKSGDSEAYAKIKKATTARKKELQNATAQS